MVRIDSSASTALKVRAMIDSVRRLRRMPGDASATCGCSLASKTWAMPAPCCWVRARPRDDPSVGRGDGGLATRAPGARSAHRGGVLRADLDDHAVIAGLVPRVRVLPQVLLGHGVDEGVAVVVDDLGDLAP